MTVQHPIWTLACVQHWVNRCPHNSSHHSCHWFVIPFPDLTLRQNTKSLSPFSWSFPACLGGTLSPCFSASHCWVAGGEFCAGFHSLIPPFLIVWKERANSINKKKRPWKSSVVQIHRDWGCSLCCSGSRNTPHKKWLLHLSSSGSSYYSCPVEVFATSNITQNKNIKTLALGLESI